MNRIFLSFDKSALPPTLAQVDRVEQFHNVALGLLNIAFGKVVRVEFTGGCFQFTERQYSAVARISAIALFILALPFTIPLALAGVFSLSGSASFHDTHQRYERANQPRANIVWPTSTLEQHRTDMDRYLGNRAPADHAARSPAFLETDKPMPSMDAIRRSLIDSRSAYQLRQGISQIISLAKAFDSQIQAQGEAAGTLIDRSPFVPGDFRRKPIDHEIFQFSPSKWEKVMTNSYRNDFQGDVGKILEECRLDLVEALAEYNAPESRILSIVEHDFSRTPPSFLSRLVLPPECPEAFQSVLEEAKNTFKGQAWFFGGGDNLKYHEDVCADFERPAAPDSDPCGPYIRIHMTQRTDKQGERSAREARAHLGGHFLHVDLFLNVNQNGRLVIPAEGNQKQVILRCSGQTDVLEEFVFRTVLFSLERHLHLYREGSKVRQMAARATALGKIEQFRGLAFMEPLVATHQRELVRIHQREAEARQKAEAAEARREAAEQRLRAEDAERAAFRRQNPHIDLYSR